MTYTAWDDERTLTTVMASVRVRWTRPDDESPRARHKVLAFALTQLGSWRGIRRAGAWGWPGETVVEWFPTHMEAGDADDMIRVGSEAMGQGPSEYRSARGGMYAGDVASLGPWPIASAPTRRWARYPASTGRPGAACTPSTCGTATG